jgi:tetratricopeptide (TPR) repeat protein
MSRYLKSILLAVLLSNLASAGNSLLSTADSLAAAGYHDDAVTEYYRFIFFHPEHPDLGDVYAKTAFCFAEMGQWEKALRDIDMAIWHDENDSLKDSYTIDKAVILAASGDLEEADSILEAILAKYESEAAASRAADLLLLTSILRYDWPQATETLKNSSFDDESKMEIDGILQEAMETDYKSPRTATMLSTMFPGAGQFYTGNYLSGLNAFALNGLLAWATGHLLLTERYGYGILTFYFGLRRYYEGNRNNAYEMAREYNRKLDKAIEDKLIEILSRKANTDESV